MLLFSVQELKCHILTHFELQWKKTFTSLEKKNTWNLIFIEWRERKKKNKQIKYIPFVQLDISCPDFVIYQWWKGRPEHWNTNTRTGQWCFHSGNIIHWVFWEQHLWELLWIRCHKSRKIERPHHVKATLCMPPGKLWWPQCCTIVVLIPVHWRVDIFWTRFILNSVRQRQRCHTRELHMIFEINQLLDFPTHLFLLYD